VMLENLASRVIHFEIDILSLYVTLWSQLWLELIVLALPRQVYLLICRVIKARKKLFKHSLYILI